MLSNHNSYTMIAAKDLARAKQFYREQLGLMWVETIPGLLQFQGPTGSRFCLFASPVAGSAKNAVMGWEVNDIAAEVSALKSRGVQFEEYDLPNFKTIDGIVTAPSGRSAWFKDSEGNLLALQQWT